MKEIVDRLQENRNIERAKSILESNGYVVTEGTKRLRESYIITRIKKTESNANNCMYQEKVSGKFKYGIGSNKSYLKLYDTKEEAQESLDSLKKSADYTYTIKSI